VASSSYNTTQEIGYKHVPKVRRSQKYEPEVFPLSPTHPMKAKANKKYCVHGKVTDISKHSEAVAQPIILF